MRVGEEGRGVRTIMEMVQHTRLDCAIGSAGLMRAAVAQAALQTAAATSIIELSYNRQRDAIFGAAEAVRKYQEDAANSALHIENAMTHAFQGMEDALVTFVTTGKQCDGPSFDRQC